jgi:hypothetical protein
LVLALRMGLLLGYGLAAPMIAPASISIVGATPGAVVTAIAWTLASIVATVTYIDLRRAKEGDGADELVDVFS